MPGEVLVVDDDADMVEIVSMVLENAGYEVRSAENGKRALEAMEERVPDLVLLDFLMPVMDGLQCAQEIRSRHGSDPPIILVTAAEHARSRGEEVQADEVLPKPFELKALVELVSRFVPSTKS